MTSTPVSVPHFAQVALSVPDMPAAVRFFTHVLGFQPAGGRFIGGEGLSRIQGVGPDPYCIVWWLVNDQPFFQLELFQYTSPVPATRGPEWRPSDIGYATLTFAVSKLDETLARAAELGITPSAAPVEVEGRLVAVITGPAGIPIELVSDAEREGPARLVEVSASVPDLGPALTYFRDTLGMNGMPTDIDPQRAALFGLHGAVGRSAKLRAGSVAVRLREFTRPAPRPRRIGHQIYDHGILNIALGFRDWDAFAATYRQVLDGGYRRETAPMGAYGAYDVSYTMDHAGFSVELLWCPEESDRMLGFIADDAWGTRR